MIIIDQIEEISDNIKDSKRAIERDIRRKKKD